MKYFVASDIHGDSYWAQRIVDAFKESGADKLILLGDTLYHGPRNDLPEEYRPKKVIEMLNGIRDRLLCVRGNCDCEVDQMVLNFPILADYAVLDAGNKLIYATHGHVFNPEKLPPLKAGDVLLFGHTHVPLHTEKDGILCLNPGSVSIPKEGSAHSYMTWEDGVFCWKTTEGKEYDRLST